MGNTLVEKMRQSEKVEAKSEAERQRGAGWSEQRAGIALQNWISLHGWLIPQKSAS